VAKSLASNQACIQDWENLLKIDPSNTIAWNDLAACRANASWMLWRLGRDTEALETSRAALDVEHHTIVASFLAADLTVPAGGLVYGEAEQGDRRQAEAARAENLRLLALAIRDLPSDSFPRAIIQGNNDTYAYAIPLADGDYSTVRKLAQEAVIRTQRIKTDNPQQARAKNAVLVANFDVLADAQYHLHDYAAAQTTNALAQATRQRLPKLKLQDELDAGDEQMLAATIAARQERYADAQGIIAPVLKLHRELVARGSDDLRQHVQLARALYASALASPGERPSQLAEATAIIDGLPPAMRREISIARLRAQIAEERTKRR
jgi:hypothetical protein